MSVYRIKVGRQLNSSQFAVGPGGVGVIVRGVKNGGKNDRINSQNSLQKLIERSMKRDVLFEHVRTI